MKQRARNIALIVPLGLSFTCVIAGAGTADGIWLVPAVVFALGANWVGWGGQ
ncbi:Uncharacterised protein [Mycobacteroides abscessus subsp. massiliense]|uniref:hypothetical protein n=1 Tax=Mycobacteroides abscessus TaxID=36809 RepID=UPI0009CC9378|nr:hypothetical protein [Mycobacteroides abscessus]SKM82518.1 Uncharacterised protein [Mycobacteroides abscessus subsp. massiliense]SKM99238.1 Uncharacterised protein [Mycobacteroides abscessus subsp. massiliense]SKN77837.1 Uncharacterised protein [Mycobacteroides abscessus subsp. massiliense]SKN95402.1 Uncharacterised protein [Mycobacteroides abscessus subsp. massiliense]SKO23062.1 Uncharacterised protein [Mycobacteroides abscessus subsp. massiliense]